MKSADAAFADIRMYVRQIIRVASIMEMDAKRHPARLTISYRAQEIDAIARRLLECVQIVDPTDDSNKGSQHDDDLH